MTVLDVKQNINSLSFHWHVWQLLQELASKQHISVSGKTLKFCMFVVFFVRQQNIFHTSHFLAAVSSCKGSSNLIQFNYAIKDSFSAATIRKMAFLLSLLILFPLSVLSKSDPDNLSVHLHSNKSKVSSGRIWYLTIFQKGLHIQPSELEGASKHTAAGHIGDNTQNIARSTTDPEY